MWPVFNQVASNAGMSFEWIICFLVLIGGLVFYAKDFKLGVLLHFLTFAGVFAWFYEAGLNYAPPIILMFMWLVILAFSLYAVAKTGERGAFI